MRRLLLVRPEPGLSASAAKARGMGLEVTAQPLFEVVPVPWTAPPADRFDAMLLTSANAVRHGGAGLKDFACLPVHAVGRTTADTAREANFQVESVGEVGVSDLLDHLPLELRLFHPGGRHRTDAVGHHNIVEATVYESRTVEPITLPGLSGWVVAVHSARAGTRLAALVGDRDEVTIAAISEAAADACGPGWQAVAVAPEPSDDSLLALAAKLCQTNRP